MTHVSFASDFHLQGFPKAWTHGLFGRHSQPLGSAYARPSFAKEVQIGLSSARHLESHLQSRAQLFHPTIRIGHLCPERLSAAKNARVTAGAGGAGSSAGAGPRPELGFRNSRSRAWNGALGHWRRGRGRSQERGFPHFLRSGTLVAFWEKTILVVQSSSGQSAQGVSS